MNIQAMMKQAQKLQQDMMKAKTEIDETEFTAKNEFVSLIMTGNKKLKNIKINNDNISNDDIEILEDMIILAVNDAISQIDSITEKKLGKFTNGMPGLF